MHRYRVKPFGEEVFYLQSERELTEIDARNFKSLNAPPLIEEIPIAPIDCYPLDCEYPEMCEFQNMCEVKIYEIP